MADHPFLLFPGAASQPRQKRGGGGGPGRPVGPSGDVQSERLAPRFEQLVREFEERRQRLQSSLGSAYPEDVLVFEVADSIPRFAQAVSKAGLAWLAEQLDEDVELDDWRSDDKPVRRQTLYFVGATESGQRQLLALWARFQRDPATAFPHGDGAWRQLFLQLVDVRPYGRADRLSEETVDEMVSSLRRGESLRLEVELWHKRGAPDEVSIQRAVQGLGGRVVSGPSIFPGAGVTMFLVEVDAQGGRRLCEEEQVLLADLPAVRALRVASQAESSRFTPSEDGDVPSAGAVAGEPVIAVLDGLPIENHHALKGAIVVDDPEGWGPSIPVSHRKHGTAVVSVALWRDLDHPAAHGRRPVYVRPVLRWPGHGDEELAPADQVFADLVHGAVVRMCDPERGVAKEVAVINLSVGISNRIYDGREPSPLARVLDDLAWRYKVLFLVAAGNEAHHQEPLDITTTLAEDNEAERRRSMVRSLRSSVDERRIFSPAESVNALTIGALDEDETGRVPESWSRCWAGSGPGLYSRCGLGHRRSLKPELVAMGGQQPIQVFGPSLRRFQVERAGVGVAVAALGSSDRPLKGKCYSRGTSFAAPRLAHAASRLSDALDDLALASGRALFEDAPRSVWLKCLLAHAASRAHLRAWAAPEGEVDEGLLDRFVGFGEPDLDRLAGCTDHRVTVLAGGWLRQDDAQHFELPLPAALLGAGTARRQLRATVAWLTPPHPPSVRYRAAKLQLSVEPVMGLRLGSQQVDHRRVERGTVIHRVWEKRGRFGFAGDAVIPVTVSCMADALTHVDEPIPYALAVSFDVEPELDVAIYEEIRTRLGVAVRPTVHVRV